jgi:hypothetical protein
MKYLLSGPSIPDAVPGAPPVFVITTKGKEFAMQLLKGAGAWA